MGSPIFSVYSTCSSNVFNIGLSFWHMARGKVLSDDLRDVLLHMAQSLDINTITHYTVWSQGERVLLLPTRHYVKGSVSTVKYQNECGRWKCTGKMNEPVTATTLNALHANLVSTTLISTDFFMGGIPLHTWKLFSERITFFHPAVVSEVHVLRLWDPHFRTPQKINQIVYFKVGRIPTNWGDSDAPKIIEIVRSELWAQKIAVYDAMWPTANFLKTAINYFILSNCVLRNFFSARYCASKFYPL
jgi:hypothetical protein